MHAFINLCGLGVYCADCGSVSSSVGRRGRFTAQCDSITVGCSLFTILPQPPPFWAHYGGFPLLTGLVLFGLSVSRRRSETGRLIDCLSGLDNNGNSDKGTLHTLNSMLDLETICICILILGHRDLASAIHTELVPPPNIRTPALCTLLTCSPTYIHM